MRCKDVESAVVIQAAALVFSELIQAVITYNRSGRPATSTPTGACPTLPLRSCRPSLRHLPCISRYLPTILSSSTYVSWHFFSFFLFSLPLHLFALITIITPLPSLRMLCAVPPASVLRLHVAYVACALLNRPLPRHATPCHLI